eukprot:31312-Eustigmatos_ZCMA.PRE.1
MIRGSAGEGGSCGDRDATSDGFDGGAIGGGGAAISAARTAGAGAADGAGAAVTPGPMEQARNTRSTLCTR